MNLSRGFRNKYKSWQSSYSSSSSSSGGGFKIIGGGGGGGSVELYSDMWWFWSEAGRGIWKECKAKGKDSSFWKDNKCDSRQKPAKGSKWWWWTSTGRKVWKECKEKGDTSPFWKENDCEAGR